MYSDVALNNYLQESAAIETKSKVLAEWNLNIFENIATIGNYKNRPIASSTGNTLPDDYTYEDETTTTPTWYGYTDYDTVLDGGYTDETSTPVTFLSSNERQKSLMSLEDCFKRFRPRSGINKLRGRDNGRYILPVYSNDIFARPRYYPAGRNDNFKYWSSYRKKENDWFGLSKTGDPYLIQDTAPFVVYKNKIPTNKIVMKIQTNVSKIDNGSLINKASPANKDPFFIDSTINYKSTPLVWKIQKLDSGDNWVDIYTTTEDQFTSSSGWDGYFQLSYGITNQELISSDPLVGIYKNNFKLIGTLLSTSALPNIIGDEFIGQSFLVKSSDVDKGTLYIYNGGTNGIVVNNYTPIVPTYGWYKSEESLSNSQLFVTELDKTLASKYTDSGITAYREFEYIGGLRIVVNRMIKQRTTFDLIELSPRLSVDMTDLVSSFSLKKYASDLGVSSLPVGQLLASNGTMSVFDYNQVLNTNSVNSLLNIYDEDALQFSFVTKNLQLKFYEIVSRVLQDDDTYKDYYIPLKTMYSDGFPQYDDSNRNVSIQLRDFVFYFESQIAPEIFLTNASLSYIVATLLDSIGFSNYTFTRLSKEKDVVIPNFFISPNKTIIQVLQDLAIATQTAMFFDESNNFVVMGKRYLVPDTAEDRPVNITIYGSDTGAKKANIINISSESRDIYNDGKITYYNRYIQKRSNNLAAESYLDREKSLEYQKVVLWSINDVQDKITKSQNEEQGIISGYPLTAAALASKLTDKIPKVQSQEITNNTIEFGDNVYWLARYNGYLYANGEIIRYDAIQYSVNGQDVWITSADEYANYFGKVSFGQKMYPTGFVRIYAEPKYNADGTYVEGAVAKHGRGQFGTVVTSHSATEKDLDSDWKTAKTPLVTDWQYIFKDTVSTSLTNSVKDNKASLQKAKMKAPTTTIKNFLSIPVYSKSTQKYTYKSSLQASALLLSGPNFTSKVNNGPSLNYVKKNLGKTVSYDTFGTRLRLLGSQMEKPDAKTQILSGSYPAYTSKNVDSVINAESGGIGIMTNDNGEGYYYEILALNYFNTENFIITDSANTKTIIFYKLKLVDGILRPTVLFSTFQNILVDTGKFTAKVKGLQDSTEDSIYDLGVKVSKVNSKDWRFSIYFNGFMIGTAQDTSPITNGIVQGISLFTRGSSQVMFNDVYAMKTMTKVPTSLEASASSEIFNTGKTSNLTYNKYSFSTLVASGFLSSLSPSEIPETNIYYEEFGTIMRECAYFNVKFDKAYPALRSLITPQPASLAKYLVTGYNSTPYRAEFLVFNLSDFTTSLGDGVDYTTILNIVGVTFTEEVARELTVDGFYSTRSNFSTNSDYSSQVYKNKYIDIKNNRLTYGNKSFSIDSPYIQNETTAVELMDYIINKISKPRKAVAVQIFGMPTIQLGDLVDFSYDTQKTLPNAITGNNYVVYAIEHETKQDGPSTILYLSEVT